MRAPRAAVPCGEIAQLAEILETTLIRIDRGVLLSSPSTRLRIEGAIAALRILSGDAPDTIVEKLLGGVVT